MTPRRVATRAPLVLVVALAFATFVAGCGGTSNPSAAPPQPGSSAGSSPGSSTELNASSTPTPSTPSAGASCPPSNTRSFAKTRFVADVGGAAFLIRRYIYQPYRAGTFTKGASGRRLALVKATAAAAASAKLLKNASENAKANPTLCRTIASPLSRLTSEVSSLTHGGSFDPGTLAGLESSLSGVLGAASSAGIDVKEQPRSLG